MEPWTRVAEEPLYDGDFLSMARRRYRRPDGGQASFEVTLQAPGVSVLALTGDDRVVLVREFRPGPERFVFDLPSGFIDPGEEPVSAASRELAEETGYRGVLREVGRTTPHAYSSEVRHVFVATDCRPCGPPHPQGDEDISVELVTLHKLRLLLRDDQMTVVDGAYLALDAAGLL